EAGRVGFHDAYDHGAGGRSRRALAALTYTRRAPELPLRASLHAGWRRLDLLENITGFLLDPARGDRRAQQHRAFSLGSELELAVPLAPAWRLEAGLGMRGDRLEQAQDHVDERAAPLERER